MERSIPLRLRLAIMACLAGSSAPAAMAVAPTVRAHARLRVAISPRMVAEAPVLPDGSDSARMLSQPEVAPLAPSPRPYQVAIAGGGIGGLCTALVLLNMGYEVRVFEKTQNYRPFGGPIQVASNAAESIRRIDEAIYEKILARATVIGDRTNGLKDGLSDEWFATFDLDSPARRRGQVSSVVIDRPILQEILLEKVGAHVTKGAEVVGAREVGDRVVVQLSDGSTHEADMLVGSDGIKSRVRDLFDPSRRDPVWSGYTCVAGMAYVVPHDIKEVGYKVWVGPRKYFVSVDVGGGRIQWYAFLNIPPGTVSVDRGRLIDWLRTDQFDGWAGDVHLLLDHSPDDEVEQRDLYDRPPDLQWSNGRVCLLGDAAHPMMPNLGQGGGMAIEDALVLGQELSNLKRYGQEPPALGRRDSIPRALRRYNQNRVLRAAAVQGLSRLSSAFLFQYQPPIKIEWEPSPRIVNWGPRSLITRACQGFLQKVAFPLQFEFLFSFPGEINPEIFAESAAGDYGTWQATESPRRQLVGPRKLGSAERELVSGGMSLREWFSQYW